jgi:hypothetical protein
LSARTTSYGAVVAAGKEVRKPVRVSPGEYVTTTTRTGGEVT